MQLREKRLYDATAISKWAFGDLNIPIVRWWRKQGTHTPKNAAENDKEKRKRKQLGFGLIVKYYSVSQPGWQLQQKEYYMCCSVVVPFLRASWVGVFALALWPAEEHAYSRRKLHWKTVNRLTIIETECYTEILDKKECLFPWNGKWLYQSQRIDECCKERLYRSADEHSRSKKSFILRQGKQKWWQQKQGREHSLKSYLHYRWPLYILASSTYAARCCNDGYKCLSG